MSKNPNKFDGSKEAAVDENNQNVLSEGGAQDKIFNAWKKDLENTETLSEIRKFSEKSYKAENYAVSISALSLLQDLTGLDLVLLAENYAKQGETSKILPYCSQAIKKDPTNKFVNNRVYQLMKPYYSRREYQALVEGMFCAVDIEHRLDVRIIVMLARCCFNIGEFEDSRNIIMLLVKANKIEKIPADILSKIHLKTGMPRDLYLFLKKILVEHSFHSLYSWLFNVMRLQNRGRFIERYLDQLELGLLKDASSAEFVLNVIFMAEQYDRVRSFLQGKNGLLISEGFKNSMLLKIAFHERSYSEAINYYHILGEEKSGAVLKSSQISEMLGIQAFAKKWASYIGDEVNNLNRTSLGKITYLVLSELNELKLEPVQGQAIQTNTALKMGGVEQQLIACSRFLKDERKTSEKGPKTLVYLKSHNSDSKIPDGINVIVGAGIDVNEVEGLPAKTSEFLKDILNLKPKTLSADIVKAILTVAKYKPEVIHIRSPSTKTPFMVAAAIFNIPKCFIHVGNIHPIDRPNCSDFLKFTWRSEDRFTHFMSIHYPALMISGISRPCRKSWSDELGLPFDRTIKISNCIYVQRMGESTESSEKALREKLNIPQNAFVVGTVSRIDQVKNPQLWLRIAIRFARFAPNAHFLVVGNGPMLGHIQHLVKLAGLTDRFHFAGMVKEGLADYYSIMDVFMMTTYSEGLCNVAFEATYFNKPVLAPKVGGLVESVMDNQTGWLLDPNKSEEFVQKLVDIYEKNPGHQLPTMEARQEVMERFSIDQMIQDTLTAYGWSGNGL